MANLAGFLKPSFFGLIMAVLLLFAQALCDLNLPNYMSGIVNVGIQQHGIENSTPKAISKAHHVITAQLKR
jgi:ATP-binding cassette subfamily B multidrug efflux pump